MKNKVVLITGGGTGIGKACALAFARNGAHIAICGRRPEPLVESCHEIEALGVKTTWCSGDIGNPDDVHAITDHTARQLGGIDCLINNASVVGQVAPVAKLGLEPWNAVLRINLTGAMLCSQAVIPFMKARGGGAIVNVSSNVGRRGFPNRAPYVCSKWALHGLTQTLALELAADNIRVNAICPGPVMTERLRGSIRRMAEARGISTDSFSGVSSNSGKARKRPFSLPGSFSDWCPIRLIFGIKRIPADRQSSVNCRACSAVNAPGSATSGWLAKANR